MLLGFARALRAAGVAVTADRERTYLEAVAAVGLDDQPAVYHAGRATLCASPADLERYDLVYAAWFGGQRAGTKDRRPCRAVVTQAGLTASDQSRQATASRTPDVVRAQASSTEVLRHRDVATLDRRDREDARAAVRGAAPAGAAPAGAPPHARRARGDVDARRTLRSTLRRMGEPGEVRWRRRGDPAPPGRAARRRLGVDERLRRRAHPAGARLLRGRGADRGLHPRAPGSPRSPARCTSATPTGRSSRRADAIPDWSGGTRLAEGVKVFLDRWGRRGMARGAVVVVFSDGWERDQPEALGEQVRRLRAVAHRVVWVNPHRGRAGYEPVQGGIMAVLPHVDDFVAGHSMAAFEELTEVVARA